MNPMQNYVCHTVGAEWVAMLDDHGNVLPGIVGKAGAKGDALGKIMGGDIIWMKANSAFPLHIHEGAHIIYVMKGDGYIHIDGVDHEMETGDMLYVPADYPHGVKATRGTDLFLVAIGYPHHEVDSTERMTIVEE